MRRPLAFLSLSLFCASAAFAEAPVRDVQAELKTQGFYFGDVDGQNGAATGAALRRYQIRNGLEVTGEINPQTLQSLGLGGGSSAPAASAVEPAPAPAPSASNQVAPPPVSRPSPGRPPQGPPPVNLRRDEPAGEPERRALAAEDERRPGLPPGSGPANQPSDRYRGIFGGTPYASAPRVVQEETFLRAERILAERGLLPSPESAPGPATEEALLTYQHSSRLPATGRLDLEALSALHLLPGRGSSNPAMVSPGGGGYGPGPGGDAGPGPNRVARPMPYKGIWVQ